MRPSGDEWRIILDFLRRTDPALVARVGRRMLNHLSWSGVTDARALLQRTGAPLAESGSAEENRPIDDRHLPPPIDPLREAFEIASRHLTGHEIAAYVEQWIKDDTSSFLTEAIDRHHASISEIYQALERYDAAAAPDLELSPAVRTGVRVSLARRLLTDDVEFVNKAKQFLGVADYFDVLRRTVAPADSQGKLGGKSSGLLLADAVIRGAPEMADAVGPIRIPNTWYVTSDGVLRFIDHNQLEDVNNHKYLDIEQVRREYPHIVQVFRHSSFPSELERGLALALDGLGDVPLVVRSSSLLEDRIGAAFSGKYKSLFVANQGTWDERLRSLMDAVAEVYASVFGPDPIQYRANRGLLDFHEEMGVMIQEVVGTRVGPYYLPAFAGVGFSLNEFRWSPRIERHDGLLRLVPGLGTRAVDRVSEDYPVLVTPGKPGLRVNTTPEEIERYAPRRIDVINLETHRFETVSLSDLLRDHGRAYPMLRQIVSALDDGGMHRPVGFGWDPAEGNGIVTFEGLLRNTPFLARMRALMELLCQRLEMPVDIEFACDGRDLYLVQCRAQSFVADAAPATIPHDLPPERILFSTHRFVSNGRVPDLTHIVYVDAAGYGQLASRQELLDVGRAVGRLNTLLPARRFALIGPGRWGSRGDIKLGVQVTYSDINNTSLLMEVAARRGGYVPDLSFGTHFFQDMVEAGIRYLPLFPGERDVVFNETFLREAPNALPGLLPDYAHLSSALRVIDVPHATGGLVLRVLMNADTEEAIGLFATPSPER
jgi:pyruvate, water dikinase